MNDFNFFSSFEKEKQQKKSKSRRANAIIVGLILLMVLFYGSFGVRILFNNFLTSQGEQFLNAPEVKTRLADIQAKKTATDNLRTYIVEVENAKKKIAFTNKVSSGFLNTIQSAIPATVVLTSLEIQEYQVSLSGNAPQMTMTAELAHNLEATGLFTRVHVNSISGDQTSATKEFSIICDVKEVAKQ